MAQVYQEKPKKKSDFELEAPKIDAPSRSVLDALNPAKAKEKTEQVNEMQKKALEQARGKQELMFGKTGARGGKARGQGSRRSRAGEVVDTRTPVNAEIDRKFDEIFMIAAQASSAPKSRFDEFPKNLLNETRDSLFIKFKEKLGEAITLMEGDPRAAGPAKSAGITLVVSTPDSMHSDITGIANRLADAGVIKNAPGKQ